MANHGIRLAALGGSVSVVALLALLISACSDAPTDSGEATAQPLGVASSALTTCPAAFVPAASGCAMAHCDPQMSDLAKLPAPPRNADILWQDSAAHGSSFGLGCASNGTRAACSVFGDDGDNLVTYDINGRRWSSSALGTLAVSSAPMIDAAGGVIAADASHVVRFDPNGAVLWDTPFASPAAPLSPILLANGSVFLATSGGPVSALDSACGTWQGSRTLTVPGKPGYYDTANTPGARADRSRVYVSTSHKIAGVAAPDGEGRLFAIDVDPAASTPLQIRWSFPFRAPSGASVTVIDDRVYFDGGPNSSDPSDAGRVFGLRDRGDGYDVLWRDSDGSVGIRVPGNVQASFARDPRGGLWMFSAGLSPLDRRDEISGRIVQTIDVAALSPNRAEKIAPSSAMTMAGTASDPVMQLGAADLSTLQGNAYAISIDVGAATPSLRYRVRIGATNAGGAFGQFPLLRDAQGRSATIFTSFAEGAFLLGTR